MEIAVLQADQRVQSGLRDYTSIEVHREAQRDTKNLVNSLKQEIKEYKLTYQNENDKLRNELQILGIDIDRKLEKKANKNDENIEGQLKTLYAWVSELRDQMKHRI